MPIVMACTCSPSRMIGRVTAKASGILWGRIKYHNRDTGTVAALVFWTSRWACTHKIAIGDSDLIDVRFSNRPFGVKRFQTIRRCSVDVARGLALLFGIGTKALPSWDPRTRWNNL